MKVHSSSKAYLLAILAILFWSTSPTAFKLGLRFQDSYQLLTGASLTSATVLGFLVLASRRRSKLAVLRWRDLWFSGLMGLMNPVAYYLILFKAYSILPAQVAQPINMIWPIVLVLVSIPVLGQRISWRSLGAMLISFSGVAVVSWQGGTASNNPENRLGIFLALSTSVIWAFYFLYNAKDQQDPVIRLWLNFMFGSFFLLLVGFFRPAMLPDTIEGWSASIYVGIFEMGITFVLWLMAIQAAPATDRISNLVYLAPFLNLGIVRLVLKEQIFGSTLLGILLLVAGILLQNLIGKNEKSVRTHYTGD